MSPAQTATERLMAHESHNMQLEIRKFIQNPEPENWLFNHYPPGFSKSRSMIEEIGRTHSKWAIVTPNHKMIYGKYSMVDNCIRNGINYQDRIGKARYIRPTTIPNLCIGSGIPFRLVLEGEQVLPIDEKICKQPAGREYVPGCTECTFSETCRYNWLKSLLNARQIVFTPIHNLTEMEHRSIAFDESIEQAKLASRTFTKQQAKDLGIILEEPRSIQIYGKAVTIYDNVCLSRAGAPDTQESYFLDLFIKSATLAVKRIRDSNGKNPRSLLVGLLGMAIPGSAHITIFGELLRFLPQTFERLLYNCATISQPLLEAIFNATDPAKSSAIFGIGCPPYSWLPIESRHFKATLLPNPVIQFTYSWSKQTAIKFLPMLQQFLLQFTEGSHVLLVTKLDFERDTDSDFKAFFPDVSYDIEFVHYNAGRGFNTKEREDGSAQYNLVIVYGRFGFNDFIRAQWKAIGYSDDLINLMERNEIIQAIHRFRPLKHPDIPILILSDDNVLAEMALDRYPISVLRAAILENNLQSDLSAEDLATLLSVSKRTISKNYSDYIELKALLRNALSPSARSE